jgi:hypothetical protein
MKVTHTHHLLPKHLGGTDDESNLVRGVPITRHAMYHFANWQLLGSLGDYVAWKVLAGLMPRSEAILALQVLGGQRGGPKCPLSVREENWRKLRKHMAENPEKEIARAMKSAENHRKKVKLIRVEDGCEIVMPSLKEAAEYLGCSAGHVTSVAKGRKNSAKGHLVRYL